MGDHVHTLSAIPPPPILDVIPPPPILDVIPPPPIPLKVDGLLTPSHFHQYQVRTIQHILDSPYAMLWLGLGLGKTVCTLDAFFKMRETGSNIKMLIVAPLRVCELQWEQEMNDWSHLKGRFTFSKMLGTAKRRQQALFTDADIYMINYESLGWLAAQLNHYFIEPSRPLPFDMLVFDEISKMKRSESQRFKEFSPITRKFSRVIGLTASPASNGLHNLWGQFYCIDGGQRLGAAYTTFTHRFFNKGDGAYGKWFPRTSTLDEIVRVVEDITVEIPAEGNLEMPPFTEIDITVTLPAGKMRQYVKLENDFFVELDSGVSVELFNSAALSNKLLQMSNGKIYNYPEPDTNPDYRTVESVHDKKYEALDDLLRESGDEPVLLAYSFSSEREAILKKYPDARCLTGATEQEAIEIMDAFNSGALKLLIAHPLSAGHGLNLQKACSIIIWFGLNYNLELYEQFIGRVYRQGQTKPVRCYRLLARDTIDQAVADALKAKDKVQSTLKEALRAYALKRGT